MKKKELDQKMLRAGALLKIPYAIMRVKDDTTNSHFLVRSGSDHQKVYQVTLIRTNKYQKHKCTCINYSVNEQYQTEYQCKHIIALLIALQSKRKLKEVDPSEYL